MSRSMSSTTASHSASPPSSYAFISNSSPTATSAPPPTTGGEHKRSLSQILFSRKRSNTSNSMAAIGETSANARRTDRDPRQRRGGSPGRDETGEREQSKVRCPYRPLDPLSVRFEFSDNICPAFCILLWISRERKSAADSLDACIPDQLSVFPARAGGPARPSSTSWQ